MRRKWSTTSKAFLALAVAFGAAAYLVVNGYVERVAALAPAEGGTKSVLVATTSLPRGAVLAPASLRHEAVPTAYVPPGTTTSLDRVVGRTLLAGVAAGEVITETRLGPEGGGPLASLVPRGFRAFTVTTSLPPGSIRAGDRVDVMATFAGGRPHTETVVQEVEVLAVTEGGSAGGPDAGLLGDAGVSLSGGGVTLTLMVLPDQAEHLAYARAFADLSVSIAGAEEDPT